MKLIDKDAVVTEIERRIKRFREEKDSVSIVKTNVYKGILSFLDTLEVKEVDLNKEIKDYFNNQPIITRSKGIDYQLIPSGEEIAKHFFELGLKTQKEK